MLILAFLLIGAVVPSTVALSITHDWPGLLLNLGTDFAGAFVTYILIDLLIGGRQEKEARDHKLGELRAKLVHRLGSRINQESCRAAEELRGYGWLTDGSLAGSELIGANLDGVDLRWAVLRGVRMYRASLRDANLYGTDLSDSYLTGASLAGAQMGRCKLDGAWLTGVDLSGARRIPRGALARANRLKGATMPDGTRYNGCYGLPGDLREAAKAARQDGRDPRDPAFLAEWYGVPLEVYLQGQGTDRGPNSPAVNRRAR